VDQSISYYATKGDGDMSESDHRSLVREVSLAQKADFLGFITVFLGEMPIRFHRGWCVSAY
jgi:hypothetical protein